MAITKISLENFKSFEKLDLELGNFNVLVGANASGKSNFTQAFKFVRDIEAEGLSDAISQNWGIEALRNINLGKQRDMAIHFTCHKAFNLLANHDLDLGIEGLDYLFSLGFAEEGKDFNIIRDEIVQELKLFKRTTNKNGDESSEEICNGELCISSNKGRFEINVTPPEFIKKMKGKLLPDPEDIPVFFKELPNDTLLIQRPLFFFPPSLKWFGKIGIYDINPRLAKGHVELSGKSRLEEDGRNLPIILNKILKDEDSKRKLMNLLQSLLPFVADVNTENITERSLMMSLQENYYQDQSLKAYMLSDGTINIVAFLVALYFEDNDVVIIEEPERNIHPRLISRVVEMMKDAARTKQVIITTHSPEIVKHAGLDNLLLVSRNEKGFSTISKPGEKECVRQFLSDELGLDDLFVQDLLSV